MIVAVVTVFHPDHSLLENLKAVRPQVDNIVVVDDGSGPSADALLDSVAAAGDSVVRLDANSGIAVALNRGIDRARDLGATSVLTLDQDSAVTADHVARTAEAYRAAKAGSPVGFVVPEYFSSVRQSVPGSGTPPRADHRAIQSGMLIPLDAIDRIGPFREDLFIDLVDLEYILRSESRGFPGVAAPGLNLEHSLGASYENRLFGIPIRLPLLPSTLTLSSPFRYYYRARNRIVVNRLHGRRFGGRLRRDTLIDVLHFANVVLVARPRISLGIVFGRAVRDALTHRLGRAPAEVLERSSRISWRVPAVQRNETPITGPAGTAQ
jgi:rhamnosyltransferase